MKKALAAACALAAFAASACTSPGEPVDTIGTAAAQWTAPTAVDEEAAAAGARMALFDAGVFLTDREFEVIGGIVCSGLDDGRAMEDIVTALSESDYDMQAAASTVAYTTLAYCPQHAEDYMNNTKADLRKVAEEVAK